MLENVKAVHTLIKLIATPLIQPRILAAQPSSRDPLLRDLNGNFYQDLEIVHLPFENKPRWNTKESTAVGVFAYISFFQTGSSKIIQSPMVNVEGRWVRQGERSIDIPPGATEPLGLAIKFLYEQEVYAWNSESLWGNISGKDYLRAPEKRLPVGVFTVDVKLAGQNVREQHFRFIVRNDGIGSRLSVTKLRN